MPTGYTASVAEGKITFKDFLLQCARAFAACIEQSNSDISEKPKKIKVSSYHQNALKKAEQDLQALKQQSVKSLRAIFDEYVKSETSYVLKALADNNIKKERYEMMLLAAKHWNPPSPDHEALKNFMISQLTESIKHDDMQEYYEGEIKSLKALKFKDWKRDKLEAAISNVEYHREELEKEFKRVEKQNKWIDQLYSSL